MATAGKPGRVDYGFRGYAKYRTLLS